MVRALLDGRKTMTRRLAWRPVKHGPIRKGDVLQHAEGEAPVHMRPTYWQKVKPGDRLWVRETHYDAADGYLQVYRADYPHCVPTRFENVPADHEIKWRPSIFMPRKWSRLTLVVTATKIERLQAISEEDAAAEGMLEAYLGDADPPFTEQAVTVSRRMQFRNLWRSLHGPDAWDANPEVVALTFTAHQVNIDRMAPPA